MLHSVARSAALGLRRACVVRKRFAAAALKPPARFQLAPLLASSPQGAARGLATGEQPPELLTTELVDGVAVVTLHSPAGQQLPWGTRVLEHRINRILLEQVNAALDAAEEQEAQAVVVIGEGKFFCNGLDLQYISAHPADATKVQTEAERLLSRILTFRTPTVAAINGHFAAAGAMLGLAFDMRVMPADSTGLMFVPGIDIGLVYSPGMTELLKSKLPQPLWNDVLCFGRRLQCPDLLQHGVVNVAPTAADLRSRAIEVAAGLKSKGKDQKTRDTLHGIKQNLYKDAVVMLGQDVEDMGFAEGTWDPTGRASKS